MKPQMPMIELLNIDCMTYMAGLPDKAFDLAICDPVFGHDITGGHSSENGWRSKEHWAKATEGWNTQKTGGGYFKELFRVSKNQIVWGGNYFELPCSEGWIVWDKGQRDFSLADAELAWTSFERATRVFNYARALSNFADAGERIHPTQKPIKLYRWLLTKYAKPADKILDTHLGSGSSAIAAHQMGFDFVGMEIDKDYYQAAIKRYNNAIMQQSLFKP